MRTLVLLALYSRRYFLRWLNGRSLLLTGIANQAIAPVIGIAVWTTVLSGDDAVVGYYICLMLVQILTASYENYEFAERIYEGQMVDDLLAPHPVVIIPIANNLAMRLWHVAFGAPLLAIAFILLPVNLAPRHIVSAVPALFLAMCLTFLFTYIVALLAFWTQRVYGLDGFSTALMLFFGGIAAPVSFFPESVRLVVELLPFWYMAGFTAEVATGMLDSTAVALGYAMQVFWVITFLAIGAAVWRVGVKKYTAVGA